MNKTIKVQKGEGPWQVARRAGISLDELYRLNPKAKKMIHPDQELVTNDGTTTTVTVKKGEGPWQIAQKNGVSLEDVYKYNPKARKMIYPGDKLTIPIKQGTKKDTDSNQETKSSDTNTNNKAANDSINNNANKTTKTISSPVKGNTQSAPKDITKTKVAPKDTVRTKKKPIVEVGNPEYKGYLKENKGVSKRMYDFFQNTNKKIEGINKSLKQLQKQYPANSVWEKKPGKDRNFPVDRNRRNVKKITTIPPSDVLVTPKTRINPTVLNKSAASLVGESINPLVQEYQSITPNMPTQHIHNNKVVPIDYKIPVNNSPIIDYINSSGFIIPSRAEVESEGYDSSLPGVNDFIPAIPEYTPMWGLFRGLNNATNGDFYKTFDSPLNSPLLMQFLGAAHANGRFKNGGPLARRRLESAGILSI